jgi:hypothetical protein
MGRFQALMTYLVSIIRAKIGYFVKERAKPGNREEIAKNPAEMEYPDIPGWATETIPDQSFEKVGRIAMCPGGLAIYSDLDNREFVLSNGDIDPVLDGDTRDVMCGIRPAGKARLSTSGKALNIAISPYYYTIPLRSVLAVLDGRNRKGALWVGK